MNPLTLNPLTLYRSKTRSMLLIDAYAFLSMLLIDTYETRTPLTLYRFKTRYMPLIDAYAFLSNRCAAARASGEPRINIF